ncbi:methyltransferase [Ornithinicoccus hortensis]
MGRVDPATAPHPAPSADPPSADRPSAEPRSADRPSADPPRAGADQVAGLRADLSDAGYTVEGVEEILGPVAAAALHRGHTGPAMRATASGEGCAPLIRLWALGRPVDDDTLDAALPRTGAAGLRAMGLLGADGSAGCDLRPYGDETHTWWVASDHGETVTHGPLPVDHVLGVGGASTTLSSWTPRPQVERALDLGTGCGVQALHLSTHVGSVTATDISDRALAYAAFNAALNGMDLDLRAGSLFEPVVGEQFDLIVSNPPFVITPRAEGVPQYTYRDGGARGDGIVAGLVRSVGDYLTPGGIAHFLGNWESRAGEDWRDRVGGWLEGTGLDAWVIQRDQQDPAEYAETWVRDGGHLPGSPEFEALHDAWLDDFAARGVATIGLGVVTLHKPATPRDPWRDLVESPGPVATPMGPSVLSGVWARNWLAERSPDELLDIAWEVADDVTEERVGRPGAPDPAVIQLRQGGGLRRTVRLDTLGAALVGVCDGELTARQALQAIAGLLDADPDAVLRQGVDLVTELVTAGMLWQGAGTDSGRTASQRHIQR